MSNKKLIETLSHAGTTEADDLLAACNQAVLLIESQADKIEQLKAENKQLRAVADAANESFRDALEVHKSYRTENQSLLKDIWRWANKTIAALKETAK